MILIVTPANAEVTFTDTVGETITLTEPAERVVCVNADAAEMMAAIGAGDKVVGVVDSVISDENLMKHLPNAVSVGKWDNPGFEKVMELSPDVVIVYSSSRPKNADQFENAGIPLINLDFYKINTLGSDVEALGIMTGMETSARDYQDFLNNWEDVVKTAVEGTETPSVYAESYTAYSSQGTGSGSDLLIGIAGGSNIAADLGEQWPKVSAEWVLKENPDVILKVCSPKANSTLSDIRDEVYERTGFGSLNAVKDERIFVLNGDLAYGPRSPAGLVYIAKALHPEKFESINPSDVLAEYSEKFVPGMDTGDYFSPDL